MYQVDVAGRRLEVAENTTLLDLARELQKDYKHDILLAMKDYKLQELSKEIKEDCTVRFITSAEVSGMQAYRRSAVLLMLKAFYDVAGKGNVTQVVLEFSLGKGYFIRAFGKFDLNGAFLQKVEERMKELVEQDLPIEKRHVHIDEAMELFHKRKTYDKEKLFRYRRSSGVNLYRIDNFEDYYYGYMVPSTGYIKYFKLYPYRDGFVLQLPERTNPEYVAEFVPQHKLFDVLMKRTNWCDNLGIGTIGDLNDKIVNGELGDMILVQEAIMEKELAEIAEVMAADPSKKIVLIAGPSSSGKTTFSHRLSVQLRAHGMIPHPIAVDNYFVEREDTPRDENGNYNFEDIECVDLKLFNDQMNDLLAGKKVELPTFNFKTGKKEYRGNTLQLGEEDILVIEGIHCLNPKMSETLPEKSKFKIYLSALTTLNIDEHNRVSTTDGRLLRRMVRDARTRGSSAKATFSMWESVQRGERKNIFPYQEEADVMFNSSLIYEMSVLKQYAEPLLFGIKKEDPEYQEAKRLLKFLDYFLGVDSTQVPQNSILREFIGGGTFHA